MVRTSQSERLIRTGKMRLIPRTTFLQHQIQYQVTANFVSDVLRGDSVTEMKVVLIRIMDEEVPAGDD